MKLRLLAMVFFITLMMACTTPPTPKNNMSTPVPKQEYTRLVEYYPPLIQEEIDDAPALAVESRRGIMVGEVVKLWTMFYDDELAPTDDPRRTKFQELAEYLVDAIIMYENEPTDIGGQLPKNADTHLLLATLITKESSVSPNVVGSLGEVGLMQLHGLSLAGYDPELVRNNTKLGVILGVRWFTYQTSLCKPNKISVDKDSWRIEDWSGPLSAYAGGPKAINKKTGKCQTYTLATNRINLTKMYRTRINSSM